MKKIINKKEPWFKWLTRELNSYEAFQDFELGKNPKKRFNLCFVKREL